MAAGPEISIESAASTTVAGSITAVDQSSPKTEVAVTNQSDNFNVAKPDDNDSVVNNVDSQNGSDSDSKSEMKMQDIVDILSNLKLNPMAKEFFPSSYSPIDRNGDQTELTLNYFAPAYFTNSPGDGIEAYPNNRRVC